jgi:hypothetical protein
MQKAPKPPDYAAAAAQTAESDADAARDATYANRVNQNNPWGNVSYDSYLDTDPRTGEQVTRWNENTTLTPQMQAALDAQMGLQQGRSELAGSMMGDLQQDYGSRMNFDQYGDPINMGAASGAGGAGGPNYGNLPEYQRQQLQKNLDYSGAPQVGSPEWTRAQAEKSVYDRGASRLDPRMEQESQALDVRLRSQGLGPGDEAYDAQMDDFNRNKTDAYQALQNESMMAGGNEASRMFGMESAYRDQSTGEQDRMGQFYNNAGMGQMGSDLAARLGEGGMMNQKAMIGNQANQQNFQQGLQQLGYNQNMANQLRSQGMNEDMQQRAYRLNEVNSLISGQQVNAPQFGNYAQQGQTRGADYLGAAGTQ